MSLHFAIRFNSRIVIQPKWKIFMRSLSALCVALFEIHPIVRNGHLNLSELVLMRQYDAIPNA